MNWFKQQFLICCFLSWTFTASAQFWQAVAESLLLDGFWYVLVETPEEPKWQETTFASYPYDLRGSGLFLSPDFEGDQRRVNFNFQFQSTQNDILGAYAQIKYSPISLLTVNAARMQYFDAEKEPSAENLNVTSVSLLYNRLRRPKIHAWWGLGGIWLDQDENTGSASFVMGGNWYFTDPISLYGETQYGLSNGNLIALSELRLQLHLRRYLIYGGFNRTRIGDLRMDSWMIGGGVYF